MTVAVSCNLSDGVVLGVDSAVTIPDQQSGGIAKVYENAEKIFQLGSLPIGVAIYGLGLLGMRSIGSYLKEFVVRDGRELVDNPKSMSDTVEALRGFFMRQYQEVFIPLFEQQTQRTFVEVPPDQRPAVGMIVGGFGANQYLSEVWNIVLPQHDQPNSATVVRQQGDYGSNWFAMYLPIARYLKGWDNNLMQELLAHISTQRGSAWTPEELKPIYDILARYEYQVPIGAMPMEEGVAHVRFLVELVINHHRFALGAPVVGGGVRIGRVTYKGEQFQILDTEVRVIARQ